MYFQVKSQEMTPGLRTTHSRTASDRLDRTSHSRKWLAARKDRNPKARTAPRYLLFLTILIYFVKTNAAVDPPD